MKKAALWIGGVVVLLAIGVLLWFMLTRPASAEDAAIAYLRALETGDVTAVEQTGVPVSDDALGAFATAEGRISDPRVETSTVHDEDAVMRVSFSLGGEEHTADLTLALVEGRWTPGPGTATGSVTLRTSIGGHAESGEAVFAVDDAFALLPAEYVFRAAPAALLDGATSVLVLPGEAVEASLAPELRPEATTIAQEQLDTYLVECTTAVSGADATTPPSCGIRIPWGAEFTGVSGIRYRIEKSPTLTLDATGFRAVDGTLVATITGTGRDGAERSATYRTDSWAVQGDVSFTDDDILLSVR